MYLTIEAKHLRSALPAVQAIASAEKIALPILKHLLLLADASSVVLGVSNEEISLRYRLPATVQAPGSALVPAHFFAGFVHDLPQVPLTLLVPSPTDATAAQIRCARVNAHMKLGALPIEEFPAMPIYPESGRHLLTINCELLREAISQVAFAAASHSEHPVLEGVRMAFEHGQASFAAADAFRLYVRRLTFPDQQLCAEVILSARTLRTLARLLPSSGSVSIALASTGNQMLFHVNTLDASALDVAIRLIAGTFPTYGSFLTAQPSTRVVAPTHALAEAVRLCAPFARENAHRLHLHVRPQHPDEAAALVLEAQAPDLGANEIRLDESITVEGAELTLVVNDTYLADALAVVQAREVALEFSGATHPLAMKPVDPLDHVSIIMPQVLRNTPAAVAQKSASVARAARA
ncbi:MAG TPA: DNA polymerase III subunit beta [Ktedonobacteraceae bacterium]